MTPQHLIQIETELTASLVNLNKKISAKDDPSINFNKAIEHFKDEFRRLKSEQYKRIEASKEAQLILMNECDKKTNELNKNIDRLHTVIKELRNGH